MGFSVRWLVSLVALGCGGQSVTHGGDGDGNGDDHGDASGGSAASSSSGGTGIDGGATSVGGVGVAGTATGGKGGSPSLCSLPADPGPCESAEPAYAFDPQTGLCLPFYYGGCEGNANRFMLAEDCYQTCEAPAVIGAADCALATDCMPIPTECCSCESFYFGNVVAVNRSAQNVIWSTKCGPVDCEACTSNRGLSWFGATCRQGHCVAYDARDTEMTECSEPSDCVLRNDLGCCEACSSDPLSVIAVNRDPSLGSELLCADHTSSCPACPDGRVYPPIANPDCYGGRCTVLLNPI